MMMRCRVKRQRHPRLNYKALSVDYMGGVSRRPPWDSALQGVVDTNTQKTIRDAPDLWKELLQNFPSPGVAIAKCMKHEEDLMTVQGWTTVWGPRQGAPLKDKKTRYEEPGKDELMRKAGEFEEDEAARRLMDDGFVTMGRGVKTPALSLCSLANNWSQLIGAAADDPGPLRRCDREGVRNTLISPKNIRTIDGNKLTIFPTGWGYKGVDMLMLDVGCPDRPVLDRHMARLTTETPDLDERAVARIQSRKDLYDAEYEKLINLLKNMGATDNTLSEKHVEVWLEQAAKAEAKLKNRSIEYGEEAIMDMMRGYGLSD